MSNELQVINPAAAGSMDILSGMLLGQNNARYRVGKNGVLIANKRRYHTQVYNSRFSHWMNSLLLKDEWEELDAAPGQYIVGFIVEDLDGNKIEAFEQVTVE